MSALKQRRLMAVLASGALVGGVLVGAVATPASADDYTQTNSAPVISSMVAGLTMQPDQDASSATYTVSATITDANTLLDLDTVKLCMSLTSAADQSCASPNGTTATLITWTRVGDTWAINDGRGAFWTLAAPVSDYVATDTAAQMQFKFNISEAARQGAWTARIIADDGEATDTEDNTSNSVNYYGEVDTNRTGQSYGSIATNASANANDVSHGTIQANGATDIFYAAANFTNGGVTVPNNYSTSAVVTDPPVSTKYALDCNEGDGVFVPSGAFRINTDPTEIDSNKLTTGTAEGGSSALTASCRLSNGGGVPSLNYSGAVTVTVGATA